LQYPAKVKKNTASPYCTSSSHLAHDHVDEKYEAKATPISATYFSANENMLQKDTQHRLSLADCVLEEGMPHLAPLSQRQIFSHKNASV
jgi:hypothetical protein